MVVLISSTFRSVLASDQCEHSGQCWITKAPPVLLQVQTSSSRSSAGHAEQQALHTKETADTDANVSSSVQATGVTVAQVELPRHLETSSQLTPPSSPRSPHASTATEIPRLTLVALVSRLSGGGIEVLGLDLDTIVSLAVLLIFCVFLCVFHWCGTSRGRREESFTSPHHHSEQQRFYSDQRGPPLRESRPSRSDFSRQRSGTEGPQQQAPGGYEYGSDLDPFVNYLRRQNLNACC